MSDLVDLRWLRAFVAVVDAGSVTAAADVVRVAQPSLSRQLRALERHLGLALFDRSEHRLRLTAAGTAYLVVARELLARAEESERAARSLRGGALDSVTIAAPATTVEDVVAPFLATWASSDPLPEVQPVDPGVDYRPLRRGVDLAVGASRPPRTMASRHVADLPVLAQVPPGHPLLARSPDRSPDRIVDLRDLTEHTLLLPRAPQHARARLDAAVTAAGLGVDRRLEVTSPQVAQALAAAGRGVAVVSDDPRFDLVPLRVVGEQGPVAVRLWAAWRADHHGAAVLAGLAERLVAFCEARYPGSTATTSG